MPCDPQTIQAEWVSSSWLPVVEEEGGVPAVKYYTEAGGQIVVQRARIEIETADKARVVKGSPVFFCVNAHAAVQSTDFGVPMDDKWQTVAAHEAATSNNDLKTLESDDHQGYLSYKTNVSDATCGSQTFWDSDPDLGPITVKSCVLIPSDAQDVL